MDRRKFFRFIGIGAVTAVAAPLSIASLATKTAIPANLFWTSEELKQHLTLLYTKLENHQKAFSCLHIRTSEYPNFFSVSEIVTGQPHKETSVYCNDCGVQVG